MAKWAKEGLKGWGLQRVLGATSGLPMAGALKPVECVAFVRQSDRMRWGSWSSDAGSRYG